MQIKELQSSEGQFQEHSDLTEMKNKEIDGSRRDNLIRTESEPPQLISAQILVQNIPQDNKPLTGHGLVLTEIVSSTPEEVKMSHFSDLFNKTLCMAQNK